MRFSSRRPTKLSRPSRLQLPRLELLEDRHLLTTLSGAVFEDTNGNQLRDEGDVSFPGVMVYVDQENNGQLDRSGYGLEPDSFANGEILNDVSQLVFPSTAGLDNRAAASVVATEAVSAPSGRLVFGNDASAVWNNQQRLRFDFTLNASTVSLDVSGASEAGATVQLDAYDREGTLLGSDIATDVQDGIRARLAISRNDADIKFVIAHVPEAEAHFDNLRVDDASEDDIATITAANGGYTFFDLPEQMHVLRQVIPTGYEQVSPVGGITTPAAANVAGLDFVNRTNSIGGFVFADVGTTGVFEPEIDPAIPQAAVYLDVNGNGVPDPRMIAIDPGTFAAGQSLEHVSADARLTVANENNVSTSVRVTALDDPVVSMDGQLFTRDNDDAAWPPDNRLRIDLQSLASQVELDFIAAADDDFEQGIMIAYSAAGEELATTTTQLLAKGQRQQMVISRPDFDIRYVVAYTVDSPDPQGRLDDFEAIIMDEPITLTNNDGVYSFKPLESGDYRVAALPQSNQRVTVPSNDDTVREITVAEGDAVTDADFGLQSDNQPPVAVADFAETVEDSAIPIGVLVNDIDEDGTINEGSVEITQQPSNGFAVVTPNGFINYTPLDDFAGTDTLIYTVRDDRAAVSNSGVVTIRITEVNDAPVAMDDRIAVLPGDDQTSSRSFINVLANDADIDGTLDLSSITVVTQPANGTVSVNRLTGTITYTSNETSDSFTYVVSDNDGLTSEPATVTISELSESAQNTAMPPVASDDVFSTLEGTRIDLSLTDNDSDADGEIQSNSITVVEPPRAGSLSIVDGLVTFAPVLGFVGSDTFRYLVRDDSLLASNTAMVTINVSERDFPYQNPINSLDVNPDGFVIPRDALLIINEINNRRLSDPVTGRILATVDPGSVPAAYYDVNGDGFIAALDVLRIINFLNAQANAEAPAAEPPLAEQAPIPFPTAVAATFSSDFDPFEEEEDEPEQSQSLTQHRLNRVAFLMS